MSSQKGTMLIVLVMVCIHTNSMASDSDGIPNLPATPVQIKVLAKNVCKQLFHYKEQAKNIECQQKFVLPSNEKISSVPAVELVCQSHQKVVFTTRSTATKGMTLVALLPEDGTIMVNSKLITHPKSTDYIIIPKDQSNYTLWVSDLDPNGAPTMWYRGPEVPWMDELPVPYNIRVSTPSYKYNENVSVEVTFGIAIEGELNACADVKVTNLCDRSVVGVYTKRIKTNQTITIKDLLTDDKCTLSVHRGRHRIKHAYQTPACHELPGCIPPPEMPANIHLYDTEAHSGVGRDVIVSWDKPIRTPPDIYNVTLLAGHLAKNIILAGNTTTALFESIDEEGMYNVSIVAISDKGQAWNSARAFFTVGTGGWWLAVFGGSLLLVLLALLFGCLARARICPRYYARDKEQYFPPPEIAQEKDFSLESSPSVEEDSWEVKSERLLVHEVIGEGAFGVVRRGTLTPEGIEVAIKMLKEFSSRDELRAFRKEMELMKSVGAHPHVVSLVGCSTGRNPMIVAEYCTRGDLLSFLRCSWDVMVSRHNVKYYNSMNNNVETNYRNDLFTNKAYQKAPDCVMNKMYDLQSVCDAELTSSDILSFCRQIAMGMEFLASNRLVHRDLAARNVLVTGDKTLKIADFGLSRDVYQDNQYKQKGNGKMPVKWMALESLTHRIYTTMSDVWSFGVVMWEVVTLGRAPYAEVPAARLSRLLRAGYRMPRPHHCSPQLYDLMLECWRARPKERPSFAELHVRLDDLLNSACAEQYLSLEVEEDAPVVKPQGHFKMFFRSNLLWSWGEHYEQPWKAPQSNHYTKSPEFKPIAV